MTRSRFLIVLAIVAPVGLIALAGLYRLDRNAGACRRATAAFQPGLDVRHADADASAAVARGDRSVLAITGVGMSTPGVDDGWPAKERRLRVRILPGGSDVFTCKRQEKLIERDARYALIYNQTVLRLLAEQRLGLNESRK